MKQDYNPERNPKRHGKTPVLDKMLADGFEDTGEDLCDCFVLYENYPKRIVYDRLRDVIVIQYSMEVKRP